MEMWREDDGEVTATVEGGTEDYSYLWSDPAGQTTAVATGLTASSFSGITLTTGLSSSNLPKSYNP